MTLMEFKKIIKNNRGFSLIELLISSVATLIIMGSIFTILITYSQKSNDDQSRVRQIQESRFLLNILSSNIKNAGAVLSLANTPGFLAATPYFTGFYPLNRTDYPDGLIIASGDPDAVTTLTGTFEPASSDDIQVVSTSVAAGGQAWQTGDYGIVIGTDGYYVFYVETVDVTGTSITKRSESVYYSGLLNTSGYDDTREGSISDGIDVTYPVQAPVIRLTNFSIYLVKEQDDPDLNRKRRDLIRVVDAKDVSDVLNSDTARSYVMAGNIWDLQIGYQDYPDFPDVSTHRAFFMPSSTGSETLSELIPALQNKTIKDISINLVALTENFVKQKEILTLTVPDLGDRDSYVIPSGGNNVFSYKIYKLTVDVRNLNIVL